jgi:hypothetical protein
VKITKDKKAQEQKPAQGVRLKIIKMSKLVENGNSLKILSF